MSKDVSLLVIVILILAVIAGGLWYWRSQLVLTDNSVVVNTANVNTVRNANIASTKNDSVPEYRLLVDATATQSGDIKTYQFSKANVMNIMPASLKSMVLNETPIVSTQEITIGSTPAQELTISSAKDGSKIKIVQLTIGDTLYDFRGDEAFLQNLNHYVEFTNLLNP